MSYNKINKNNNNNNKMEFPAHSQLTRGPAGKVIRRLPELKATFPGVYVRFDEGVWTVSRSMDFKAVKEWIQAAELEAIAALSASRSIPTKEQEEAECDNADQRKQLTGVLIGHLKELQLPEGAKPIRFDNEKRVWVLRAETPEALQLLADTFLDYEKKWYYFLNPSVRGEVHVDELSQKSKQITYDIYASLKQGMVRLPPGSKRIWFNNITYSWQFACQTQQDLDDLIKRFKDHAEQVINPPPQPKMPVPQQQVPDFTADFPALTNPTV
jgi:hypothetical protein